MKIEFVLQTIVRISFSMWFLYNVYFETGKWTTCALSLILIEIELRNWLEERTKVWRKAITEMVINKV